MPIEEREGVEHHLMDFLPMDQEYTVLDFKADALELVTDTPILRIVCFKAWYPKKNNLVYLTYLRVHVD